MLTIGSLFSGIGGLEKGLEDVGLGPVVWQVEQLELCRQWLAEHWPDVDRSVTDVKEAGAANLTPVDLICGGFPCQGVSPAGNREGLADERSGLWPEYRRIIRCLRPTFIVVENSSALLHRGFAEILGDLATLGYDAEWQVLSACAVGAPHTRERLFIVAYSDSIDGEAGLGPKQRWARALQKVDCQPGPWSDRVNRSLEASRSDDRETDGFSRQMVTALGNSVVPACAEVPGWVVRELMEVDDESRK